MNVLALLTLVAVTFAQQHDNGHHGGDHALHSLIVSEVGELMAADPGLTVDDCSTKCDALFDFIDGSDETMPDHLCHQECQHKIHTRVVRQQNHGNHDALHMLIPISHEVDALIKADAGLTVDECTTKCDAMFDLINGHDETMTDNLCQADCQHKIHNRPARQQNHGNHDALHMLISHEVDALIKADAGLTVDECTTKCDAMFDLIAGHDEATSDHQCHADCQHKIHNRPARQQNHGNHDVLHTLINHEVDALIKADAGLTVDDCTTKCDAMFDLLNGHDETTTDHLCHQSCQHAIHNRPARKDHDGDDHHNALQTLVTHEVTALIQTEVNLTADLCTTKCDIMFDLISGHDETMTDHMCHMECNRQIGGN